MYTSFVIITLGIPAGEVLPAAPLPETPGKVISCHLLKIYVITF
jgi:hypothetical protein